MKKPLEQYLPRNPVELNPHNWFYTERKGIALVHEVLDTSGDYLKTDQIIIPYKLLEIAVKNWKKSVKKQLIHAKYGKQ
jgi:hypothetical protein